MLSTWKNIFQYSAIYLFTRGTFGVLGNIIFFNVFGPATLALIKIAELFVTLPQILNLGVANTMVLESVGKKRISNILTNFFLIKIVTFIIITIYILFDSLIFDILKEFQFIQKIFLIFLIATTIFYNFSVNKNFISGEIHNLPKINSLIIFLNPVLYITLGYYFGFTGWFLISYIVFLVPAIYLIYPNRFKIYQNIDLNAFSSKVIIELFKKSPLYHLNQKLTWFIEISIFFVLINFIDIIDAGIIAFCLRLNALIAKTLGNIFQKRFYWINITSKNAHELSIKEINLRIMQLSILFTILIPTGILVLSFILEYFIPKYELALSFISICIIGSYSELIWGDLNRKAFLKSDQLTMLLNLIFNIVLISLFYILFFYNTQMDKISFIFLSIGLLFFFRILFASLLDILFYGNISFGIFLILSNIFISIIGFYFCNLNLFVSIENSMILLIQIVIFLLLILIFLKAYLNYK